MCKQHSEVGVSERLQVLHLKDGLYSFPSTVHFFPQTLTFFWENTYKIVKEVKFLGLIFDMKLTFKNHIQYLKTSCQKALDILCVVGHTDWGADRIVLLRLYRSLVRSKLDYGCIVYGSARRSILKQLDPIHQLTNRVGCFPYISCSKSVYRSMNRH